MNIKEALPPVTNVPIVYPASLFHALNLGVHKVKHGQSGLSFIPVGCKMQANCYVANYQDDLGNRYTVTVEAQS
jgi:hypothetical protein